MTKVKPKIEKTRQFTSEVKNDFTFQKVGPAEWLDLMDQVENPQTGRPIRAKLYPVVLENIVVQPSMKVEDFSDEPYNGYAELEEVVTAAIRFQQGK